MRLSSFFVVISLLLVAGCGPTMHNVSGTVTYDGTALADGDIILKPKDAKVGKPEGAKIKDGKYTVKAQPGSYTVEITASKIVKLTDGKKGAMGETEMPEQYLSEKYNSKSDLSVDVAGAVTKDFELKSK